MKKKYYSCKECGWIEYIYVSKKPSTCAWCKRELEEKEKTRTIIVEC